MDILLAVLSGFAVAMLAPALQRRLGDLTGYVIALVPVFMAACFARYVGVFTGQDAIVTSFPWAPGLDLSLTFYLDGLSLLFALLISSIGILICTYAQGYLHGHPHLGRFYAYILIFMSAMLGTVLAGNLLTLYVFWELTTLSSFLLVGFDNEREAARSAAQQALLITAMGGLALLVGLILLGQAAGSFDFAQLLNSGEVVRSHPHYQAILILILLGAFTKSAQFPFHFWLPGAMQAPTPVSAYLHSATMVKAGVYLLARLSPVLGGTESWQWTVTGWGAVTMVLGAYLAFHQRDLKLILAYLTINVLGTLVMLLGMNTPLSIKAALVYLLAHALYKAALFLSAGIVDHETHTRDITELGGLARKLPITTTAVALAALSMAGMIPLFGFLAKELFLEAVEHCPVMKPWIVAAAVTASLFLVASAGLVCIRPFFGKLTARSEHAHDPSLALWSAPLLLACLGLALGLAPQRLATPLLQPAISATLNEPVELSLALWHGFTVILGISLAILAGGIVLYLFHDRLVKRLPVFAETNPLTPKQIYLSSMNGLTRFAKWQSRTLQSGRLQRYVACLLVFTVLLVGTTLTHVRVEYLIRVSNGIPFHEGATVLLILCAAGMAVATNSRLGAIAALGVVGFGVAWLFMLYGAPDLAMTQIVTEALTVVLFVLAFLQLPKFTVQSATRTRIRDGIIAGAAGVLVTVLLLMVTRQEEIVPVSEYYARNSVALAHGRNVVNVILVDFRALDTLGEITVLSTAAIGVYALIRASRKGAGTS